MWQKHYVGQNQTQSQTQTAQPTSIPAVFKFPTQGRISSTFDMRWEQMHYGIDIAAQVMSLSRQRLQVKS